MNSERYCPPALNMRQMRALEEVIAVSKNATDFAKKIIIWALRRTAGLTKQVALSIPKKFYKWDGREMQDGAHDMNSAMGTTRIDLFFHAAGTHMHLNHHAGMLYHNQKNGFILSGGGHTIWFEHGQYSGHVSVLLPPTPEEIEAVDLDAIRDPQYLYSGCKC